MNCEYVIGIDFDNTIARYDGLMYRIAMERGLVTPQTPRSKHEIRTHILAQNDAGDENWQRLQAAVYGPEIASASLAEGFQEFFRWARAQDASLYIVSHKTEFSPFDEARTNLRDAALDWMGAHGFFSRDGLGLDRSAVFFEATREAKIERIRNLRCTHFIDDLQEMFCERSFPRNVQKILYAPDGASAPPPNTRVVFHWADVRGVIFNGKASGGAATSVPLGSLLGQEPRLMERIGGGRNSQVFRAVLDNGEEYAVKRYFRHPLDSRNRLDVEFNSLRFLWEGGITCVPKPIAAEFGENVAVYSYGGRPVAGEVETRDIDEAVTFLESLHELSRSSTNKDLPLASEACFSVEGIVSNLRARLKPLSEAALESGSLHDFLTLEFGPAFELATQWSASVLAEVGWATDRVLDPQDRTLSPSDFGFHNALRDGDGHLVFVDFEYFGWDDPAKLISDFLLHPAMNLTEGLKEQFLRRMLESFGDLAELKHRVKAVLPLFALKWCLILLNEYLPHNAQRRMFAGGGALKGLQEEQLIKARRMMAIAVDACS